MSDSNENDAVIHAFREQLREQIEWETLSDVQFAMWLPSDSDPTFTASPIRERWNTIYELTKNSWSYITANMLYSLGVIEKTFRVNLPEEFMPFAFVTAQDEQVILSLSQEKGIRLHFAETTRLEYRITFLDFFTAYCRAWNNLIEENDGHKDDDIGFGRWWEATVKTSVTMEEQEPLTGVGIIAK